MTQLLTSQSTKIMSWMNQINDIWKKIPENSSMPLASICRERLFSKAELINAGMLRNRFSTDMVDKILVIKANLEKVYLVPSSEPNFDDIAVETEE
uniref:HAT C-terminal dimerisation domain-containing protein n=1 Tax=Acrobeloides nanus TaxID=290746 RepID=A0A914CWS6_9BILA